MSESVTSLSINYANGGGGHTATVTSTIGAQSAEDGSDSLGTVAGDKMGETSSFSDMRLDGLMGKFLVTETTTNADPTKKTVVRKYVDATSIKLNSYVVLVRGINAPPQGNGQFEEAVPYFGEVKGSFAPSYGGGAVELNKEGNAIIAGSIYNMETRNINDANSTSVNLIYQSKTLKPNLSLMEGAVGSNYLSNPDLANYTLKFGYTLGEFKQILATAGVEHSGLDPAGGEDVLFETSGSLASVVSSVAGYFGFYHYVDPQDGVLKFINSAIAATLDISDPTATTSETTIGATFTKSAVADTIVNTYSGTADKLDKSGMGGDSPDKDDGMYFTNFKRVMIEEFAAFKQMGMGTNELGAFFALFNQDQPPDMFDKYTYLLLVLSQRNCAERDQGWPADMRLPNGRVIKLAGNVKYGKGEVGKSCEIEKIRQPLYLPVPHNLELWAWGKDKGNWGANRILWAGRNAELQDNIANNAEKANNGHQFPRIEANTGKSRADYFQLMHMKSEAQLAWEGEDEGPQIRAMPAPSQSALYEFLKIYFAIAGGVYVSHGYGEDRARRMGFENMNNITVSGPHFKGALISEIDDLSILSDFFKILGIGNTATVKQLAELTNGEAEMTNDYHFVAIRNIAKMNLMTAKNKANKPFGFDQPANFGPLGTHIEIYNKPMDDVTEKYIGGPLLNTAFQADRAGKKRIFVKYMIDLIRKSIKSYKVAAKKTRRRSWLRLSYTRHSTEVHPVEDAEDDDDDGDRRIAGEGSPARQERDNNYDRYDHRFYDIVAPETDGLQRPSLSAASGSTQEMKVLRSARGENQGSTGSKLKTSSETIYGLVIPDFSVTMSSVEISVNQGGITTTIGHSTLKIMPPDQQFLIGQGVEAMRDQKTDSRLGAHQRNHFGL